jgi:hypothetical protein
MLCLAASPVWSPAVPLTLALRLIALAACWSWLAMSLVVRVAVLRLLSLASMAAWLLLTTPPFRSVLPFTLTWNPPSPAWMPLCSVTLA